MAKKKPAGTKTKKQADPVLAALLHAAEVLSNRPDVGDGEVCNALDEVVIDAKLSEASDVNNGGWGAQLEYLISTGCAEEAAEVLKTLRSSSQST